MELFHPEFPEGNKQSSNFQSSISAPLPGSGLKGEALMQSHSAVQGAQSRGQEPSSALHTQQQTKAAVGALQIFKWDLPAQRPGQLALQRGAGGDWAPLGLPDKH